jgi:hypothetical protein
VKLMAINTANMVRRVRPTWPVLDLLIASMATQADAVGIASRALRQADDLGNIAAALKVKAAVAMTILAFNALLLMVRVLKVLGGIRMAARARIAPNASCAGYVCVTFVSVCWSGPFTSGELGGENQKEENRDSDGECTNAHDNLHTSARYKLRKLPKLMYPRTHQRVVKNDQITIAPFIHA